MDIGIESSHGFGDCLFNIPLIQSISDKHGCKVTVAVTPHCSDAFINIQCINKIIHIPSMHHGIEMFKSMNYKYIYQITQNVKFPVYKQQDPNHSLIDTALQVGSEFGLQFNQRPVFLPTHDELLFGVQYKPNQPTVAIECIAKSGQSWADNTAVQSIVDKYADTHKILWLSNQGAPNHHNIDNLLKYSRRQIIMLLQHCEMFFSVGSGFFCANLALPEQYQAKKVVCLWIDDLYKYEFRLSQLKWCREIIWVHNHQELNKILESQS